MPDRPHYDLLNSEICGNIDSDTEKIKTIMYCPDNEDVIFRDILSNSVRMRAVFIDGMVNSDQVEDFIIRASQAGSAPDTGDILGSVIQSVIQVAQVKPESRFSKIIELMLSGMSILLIDGATEALTLDTRGFEKRQVGKTVTENVVLGSQEGFVENLRTNLTLIHRYVQSPELICEKYTVGTKIPLRIALVYVKGALDENILSEVKTRIKKVDKEIVHGIGQLMQLIEDNHWSLMPQMLMTERPDRAAAALTDGQFVIVSDDSPFALIAPCSVFSLLQASDDAFSRWQYGSYERVVRFIGLAASLVLPGLYIALTVFHTHLIPLPFLTAIAETRVNVPFPILFEVFVMELSFFLINEANIRIPSQIGSAIGIIGALVLGQAAVDASLISPILIIIIAISGLGCYAIPNYSVSIGLIIVRLFVVIMSAMLGLFGMSIALVLFLCQLCSMKSFGVDFFAPFAPHRKHNVDLLIRFPAFMQKPLLYFAKKNSWVRGKG